MRKEEPHSQTLQRVFPHARFSEREAADRAQAIEAHRRELGARLGRNVGAVVAAVDYMLNISGELVAPTIVEHEALELLEHRSVTDPLTRSEEHTSELQSLRHLVCRLLLEKKKN